MALMFSSEKVGSITGLPQPLNTPKIMAVADFDSSSYAITITDNQCTCNGSSTIYATKGFTSFKSNVRVTYYILHNNGTISSHTASLNVLQSLPSDYNVVLIKYNSSSRITVTFS